MCSSNILTLRLVLLVHLPCIIAAIKQLQCNADTRSRHGFFIIGHVFNSFTTGRLAFCYSACNTDPACQSLNYNLANKTCEFNSESSTSHPNSYQENEIYVYADNPDREHRDWLVYLGHQNTFATYHARKLNFKGASCDLFDVTMNIYKFTSGNVNHTYNIQFPEVKGQFATVLKASRETAPIVLIGFKGKKGSQATVPGVSCKNIQDSGDLDTSGTYWIRPAGSDASFQGYCDISGIGKWTKVTQSWVENTYKGGVTLTYTQENNGLVISGAVTSYGCGSSIPSGALTTIKGYWTKIKYKQEFRGVASCWSIFGNDLTGDTSVNNEPSGVQPFDAAQGDSITSQYYMGGNSHEFDGQTGKCNNLATNFWDNPNPSVRYATVILRRQLTAEKAGIFTGTSCGTPNYKIKDIYIYF